MDTVGVVVKALTVAALVAAVPVGVVLAWHEGKRVATPPRWLVSDDEKAQLDSVIDERMISLALAHLGIPALTAFFKEGGALIYTVVPRVDGDGTYAQARLPMGVTAEQVAEPRPRAKLAANLNRASLECWPTKGDEDGILDLWVADKGVLGRGAGPWPLLEDGQVDVFDGVPFGRSQRGEVITARLFESNWLIGGRPGQGKSAAMRTLLLGAALDPTVEIWAYVLGESPDFAPFAPRLSRYRMGMDDAVAEEALQALRDALAEMERRGRVLGAQPGTPPKTNRRLANRAALGLHLLVIAVDECHELFQHPDHGKEAAMLAIRLIKRGRKYGIVLLLATQSPTKDSIPREVTRNVACGVAFSVADHVANDGLLGSGRYKAGVRANREDLDQHDHDHNPRPRHRPARQRRRGHRDQPGPGRPDRPAWRAAPAGERGAGRVPGRPGARRERVARPRRSPHRRRTAHRGRRPRRGGGGQGHLNQRHATQLQAGEGGGRPGGTAMA